MRNLIILIFMTLAVAFDAWSQTKSKDCHDCEGTRAQAVSFKGTNVDELKIVPMKVEAFQLANGGTFNEHYNDLICRMAKHNDEEGFLNTLKIVFGDHKDAKSRELFLNIYPYIKCDDEGLNLVQAATYGRNVKSVLDLLKYWKAPLNHKNNKGETELDYVLRHAHQMKERQGVRNFNPQWLIYKYLKHERLNGKEGIGKFSCQLDKTCSCSDDPEDFGRSCGKWVGPTS